MKLRGILSFLMVIFFSLNMSCDLNKAEPLPPDWVFNPMVPIFINPRSQYIKPGDEFSINVEIISGEWGVSAGELRLSFDPMALEVVDIKPGSLFKGKALVGMEKVDNDKGTIIYALARVGSTNIAETQDVYAVIKFKARASAKGTSNIRITKIGLSNEKFEDVPGLMTQGSAVIIE